MALLDNENKFTPNSAATEPKQPFSLRACADACMQPTVLVLALIKVAGAMAMSVWHSTFYGGVAQADFGIDIQQLGLLTSYMGLLAMLTQVSGLVKYVTVNYDDRSINTAIGLLLALVFFAVAPIAFAGKDVPVLVLGYTTNMASLQFLVLLLPITVHEVCLSFACRDDHWRRYGYRIRRAYRFAVHRRQHRSRRGAGRDQHPLQRPMYPNGRVLSRLDGVERAANKEQEFVTHD
jgi:hypothetical protein